MLKDEVLQSSVEDVYAKEKKTEEELKAEETLRKSENKYRTLLENLPQKIFFKDKNSVYISCNENYARDLKIKSGEITGKTDYDFYPKILAEKYRADDKKIMESGKTEDIEEEYIQDGQKVFVHTVKTPVKDENGNVVGTLGIFWDITERKQAEEALKESEEKFRMIFQNVNDEIIYLDTRGKILDVNERCMELFGYKPDDVIGKNFLTLGFLQLKDIPKIVRLFKDVIIRGKAVNAMSLEIKRKNGSIVPIEASTRLVKKNGRLSGILVVVRDISERKRMEEKLKEYSEHLEELVQKRTQELSDSERRYSLLVEQASDGIGISQDAKVVFVNKKLSEMLGYSKDELIGRPIFELIHEKYRQLTKEAYEEMQKERGPATRYLETKFVAKNGTSIPVELSASRINYVNRNAAMIIVRDIRERKQMEEERLRLGRLAALGELATMVGHDLRNPLQAITNAVYFLKDSHTTVDSLLMNERYKEYFDIMPEPIRNEFHEKLTKTVEVRNKMINSIDESIEYADKIVSDLQDLARTKEAEPVEIDLESLIQETLSGISIPKNVEISIKHDQRLSKLYVDPNQLRRVFANLTTNAIQAMENGGTLTISTKKTDDFVEVSFKDTGVGIPEENMEKIFTPLFTTKAKGMGLGLPICKKFVELHGGSIEVRSQVGNGSTFTVKLPIQHEMEVTTIASE